MKNLHTYNEFLNEAGKYDSINIFDIDDTLVVTKAKIKVTDNNTGEIYEITPKEFNEYQQNPYHELDYSDFQDEKLLKAGHIIDWVFDILKGTLKKGKRVGIITARDDASLIYNFLLHHGVDINPKYIFAINDPKQGFAGNTIALRKKEAFQRLMALGFNDFTFFDDDKENIRLAKQLDKETKQIRMKTRLVKFSHKKSWTKKA